MTWTYSGNTALTVTIAEPGGHHQHTQCGLERRRDHHLHGLPIPASLCDDDAATFTVTAVNDAPVVTDIPNQTIAEGAPSPPSTWITMSRMSTTPMPR